MEQDKLTRLRSRLRELTVQDSSSDSKPWSPSPDSIVGRAWAKDPEYKRRSQHNYAVHELWSKIPCGCGRPVTAGFGILPDEPLDPSKPPKACYACASEIRSNSFESDINPVAG